MTAGRYTSRQIVEMSISSASSEIDRGGPALGSVIELNPDALAIADALDAERSSWGPRGPLHGIPVLIKDNIDTADRMIDHGRIAGARGLDRRRVTPSSSSGCAPPAR